jgi:hypothetical protein
MSDSRELDDWFAHILEETPKSTTLTVQIYGAQLILDCCGDHSRVRELQRSVRGNDRADVVPSPRRHLQWVTMGGIGWTSAREATQRQQRPVRIRRVTLVSNKLMWMVLHAKLSAVVSEFIPVVDDALNEDACLESALQRLCQLLTPQTPRRSGRHHVHQRGAGIQSLHPVPVRAVARLW